MTRTVRLTLAVLVASTAWPSIAASQSIGGGGYVSFGQTVYSATQTFEAVVGSSSQQHILVGGVVTGLWRGVFADVAISQMTLDGQRVFVDGDEVFPLGIATTVKVRPFDVIGGWRFTAGRVIPYVGAGLSVMSYKETSDFAGDGEDVETTKSGAALLAGVDVEVVRYIRVGGELRYRSIGGVLGNDGASSAFGEEQLGGVSFGARITVGF